MAKTVILQESDFRSTQNGYHLNMWQEVCEAFGLEPDNIEYIEVSLSREVTHG